MTTIQQVVFELETDYLGHPYYVSGHALYNALARRVEPALRRTLQVSHGVFAPCEYGQYPDDHRGRAAAIWARRCARSNATTTSSSRGAGPALAARQPATRGPQHTPTAQPRQAGWLESAHSFTALSTNCKPSSVNAYSLPCFSTKPILRSQFARCFAMSVSPRLHPSSGAYPTVAY